MNHTKARGHKTLTTNVFLFTLTLFAWVFVFGTTAQAQQTATAPEVNTAVVSNPAPSQKVMSCDVIYGGSTLCTGAGICKINPRSAGGQVSMEKKQGCKSTIGLLFPIEEGSGVSLVLTKQLLCPHFYNSHLQKGLLIQENNAELSPEVVQTLGLKINQLKAGSYPVKEEGAQLRIDFSSNRQ
ncbi:MAG TPA: hypothetical protein VK168_07185 [Saprospiraceae bacterium]|nr:hypothetical protein [Saprospiraceae bacterium]